VLDENTKKQIANGTEAERANALVKVLNSTYKDFNKNLRDTDAGKMQVLSNAAEEAATIIGTGLLDALKELGKNNSVEQLATNMQNVAIYTADVIRGIGELAGQLNKIPGFKNAGIEDYIQLIPILGSYINLLAKAGQVAGGSGVQAQGLTDLARLQSQFVIKTLAAKKKITTEEKKALAAAKLKLALDKANLALLKGEEVFDMDKIQIAAALTSQAEQLSKATTQSQILQIANDTARLNVKRSILALEDAIAAKDEQAIAAATAKLNADLRILGALTGQNVKLQDIKSTLDSLQPKDLINLANLDAALAKIQEMLLLLAQANAQAKATVPSSARLGSGIPSGDYIAPISTTGASIGAILEYAEAAAARANAFADLLDMQNSSAASSMGSSINLESIARSSLLQGLTGGAGVAGAVSGSRYAAQAANAYNITIQANTIANPDELTNLIQNSLIQLNRRGDSLVQAGAL
jgi:hypothetical protein